MSFQDRVHKRDKIPLCKPEFSRTMRAWASPRLDPSSSWLSYHHLKTNSFSRSPTLSRISPKRASTSSFLLPSAPAAPSGATCPCMGVHAIIIARISVNTRARSASGREGTVAISIRWRRCRRSSSGRRVEEADGDEEERECMASNSDSMQNQASVYLSSIKSGDDPMLDALLALADALRTSAE